MGARSVLKQVFAVSNTRLIFCIYWRCRALISDKHQRNIGKTYTSFNIQRGSRGFLQSISLCGVAGEVVQECAEWPCEAAAAASPGAKRAEMIPKYPCQRTMGMGHTRIRRQCHPSALSPPPGASPSNQAICTSRKTRSVPPSTLTI